MKLLFYINVLGGGGAERVIVNLANEFSKIGNQVTLVASYPVENEYSVRNDVNKLYISREPSKESFIKKNILYVKWLRKKMKDEHFDAAIAFMAEPNIRILLAGLGLRTKKIISVRNDPVREYSSKMYQMLAKLLFPLSDCVIFQTNDAKDWFSKRIQSKSEIIMNQVAEDFFEHEIPVHRQNIVTVGRLNKQKNHRLLIKAFSKICDKIEDNLIIWGEGEFREELEQYIKDLNLEDRIFLPGRTNDVKGAISSAKVFILSSDYEGMPNALLEAMALGVPCISTNCPCGGPKMIIEDCKNGYLVPVNDTDALAQRMNDLVVDCKKQKMFSMNARSDAQKYLPSKIFEKWQSMLNNVIKK